MQLLFDVAPFMPMAISKNWNKEQANMFSPSDSYCCYYYVSFWKFSPDPMISKILFVLTYMNNFYSIQKNCKYVKINYKGANYKMY